MIYVHAVPGKTGRAGSTPPCFSSPCLSLVPESEVPSGSRAGPRPATVICRSNRPRSRRPWSCRSPFGSRPTLRKADSCGVIDSMILSRRRRRDRILSHHTTKPSRHAGRALLDPTLNVDAAFRSDPDTFGLAIVIGVANRLVSSRTLVQTRLDLLARVKIEM